MRNIVIILDGCGCGELPDAADYSDTGSNTLGNIAKSMNGLDLPNLQAMGLGSIASIDGIDPAPIPNSSFGKMAERSKGKDSTVGHWELFGIVSDAPLPTYPDGFPSQVMLRFERAIGCGTLGNKPASGTVIIEELGEEHLRTEKPIVYTSADSVFQIAAHKEVISLENLYRMCEQARRILQGKHAVGRVIARPFIGELGSFERTSERKDFSLPPPKKTLLDRAKEAGKEVLGIGKIDYLFAYHGLSRCTHTQNNTHGINEILSAVKNDSSELIVANLLDFDMIYGHRNDTKGYASALKEVDDALPRIIRSLDEEDILYITSDHGNDPTAPSTDHSREYVPLLVHGSKLEHKDLGTRETFADLGQTIAEFMGLPSLQAGKSFKDEITRQT